MKRRNFISGIAAFAAGGGIIKKQIKKPHIIPERVAAEPELPQYTVCRPEDWIWESPTYTAFKHDQE